MSSFSHKPVMIDEVVQYLAPLDGKTFVDSTFGAGGYSHAILNSAICNVIALDRDISVARFADQLKVKYSTRFVWHHSKFSDIDKVLSGSNVDGIVYDLGVSSMQIDDGTRGFSFMRDGPLDMRMDQTQGLSAEDIVNTYQENDIADILYNYGDERKSYAIARAIVNARSGHVIKSTCELANIIRKSVGRYNDTIDPATRSFQALRIATNEELLEIERSLKKAFNLLNEGGRLVVVTFHSGEDAIVKRLFKDVCGQMPKGNRHMPLQDQDDNKEVKFRELHKGVITATKEEVEGNVRARSAKLRAIFKIKK